MFQLGAGCPWHGVRAGPGVPLSVPQGTGGTQHREWPRPEHHRAEAEPPCYRPAPEYCSDGETLTASAFKPRSLRRAAGRAGRQQDALGGSGVDPVWGAASDQGCRRPLALGHASACGG